MTRESLVDLEEAAAAARRESDRAGDNYYRALTRWTVSRLANGTGRKCYRLALAYDDALDKFLDRLNSLNASASGKRIAIVTEQKSLLKADLDYLGKIRMPFPKVFDSQAEPVFRVDEVVRSAYAS